VTDLASINKHDLAGAVAVVVALALLLYAWVKVAAKAAKLALYFFLVGLAAVVVAVLLFTRTI
jgi:hypothetical protein